MNYDKLAVGLGNVSYFGHILSADGLKPDFGKITAIRNMGYLCDRKDLETVLKMIDFLANFSLIRDYIPDAAALGVHFLTRSPGPVLAY